MLNLEALNLVTLNLVSRCAERSETPRNCTENLISRCETIVHFEMQSCQSYEYWLLAVLRYCVALSDGLISRWRDSGIGLMYRDRAVGGEGEEEEEEEEEEDKEEEEEEM